MNMKNIAGSALAATLLGVGVLAGSVIGNGSASAQTPTVTATATAVAPGTTDPSTAPTTPSTWVPGDKGDFGGRGGGRGHGGDGLGDGRMGGAATAEGATNAITNATDTLDSVKSDLAYATGKMDTATVEKWLNGASDLLGSAQSANTASQYGQAAAYASAASELARAADSLMAQELGSANLPSYANRPQRGDKDTTATTNTITQAQASRVLAEAYNSITARSANVTGASNASEATPYLTEAQNAYKAAYDAYGAGNYNDAVASARLASRLSKVASTIAAASTAPANADTPVTVPAPNF